MIYRIFSAILFLLQILPLQQSIGQETDPTIDYLKQKFMVYCNTVPREEIFVHTDRAEYIAGEDLWFNINLIDRQSLKPSDNSKIAYFEILNSENTPVVQKRILLDKGFGPGQIELPDSLSSGSYLLRVYTSWMKNFLPYNCFMKEINIYNALNVKSFKKRMYSPSNLEETSEGNVFPSTSSSRLTINVNSSKKDSLEIFVNTEANYRSLNNNRFFLFIQTHGIINYLNTITTTGESTKVAVPKSLLAPGINQITIFDSKYNPLIEKYIYSSPVSNKNFISIISPDTSNARSKISLEFDLDGILFSNPSGINLSISVVPGYGKTDNLDLKDYMLFGSEFGMLPASFKKRRIDDIPFEEMESFLSKIKSNWIIWKNVLSTEKPSFAYRMEKEDHYLLGTLLTSDQQLAHPGEYLLMSTPGKEAEFQYAITNYEANFNFTLPLNEDAKDLVIQPEDTTKNNKIFLSSLFSDQYLPYGVSVDSSIKTVPDNISKLSITYQVRKIYNSLGVSSPAEPMQQLTKQKRFYGKPEVEVIMQDFIKLTTMEEIFFELIPRVSLKKIDDSYEISIVDLSGNKIYETPPVLMIDGVIIKDASVIAQLDPEIVEKIDVLREIYSVGNYKFYGLVNVITKKGYYTNNTVPDYAKRFQYRITDPLNKFISPDYSVPNLVDNHIPDYRNTLYWNPSIKFTKEGKTKIEFFASDISSDYEISIQGILQSGQFVSQTKSLKVK